MYALLFLLALMTSCSHIPPADEGFVSSVVASRIDSEVEWGKEGCIHNLLAEEITSEAAIQIALLNNPKIQAFFEELGLAQADLLEAGLLSNPTFALEVRYPHQSGIRTNIEYLLMTSILDIFLIPIRTKIAELEFEQTKLRVANQILDLAFAVKQVYFEVLAEQQNVQFLEMIAELTEIQTEIVRKQYQVGNTNQLELQVADSKLLDAHLERSLATAKVIHLREELNKLLGLKENVCLIFPDILCNEITDQELSIQALESLVLETRLDLQVARYEVERLCKMAGLKEWWAYSNLQGGLAGEREPDGHNLLGPGLALSLPLFNYGQADRRHLAAEIRQAIDHLLALEIAILSEVREAHALQNSYLRILNDYQKRLLPTQNDILSSSEALYNVMGLGIDRLLDYKLKQVTTYRNYAESVKHYFLASNQLDRALGGYLSRFYLRECIE